jgi:hypothetical protein
MGVVHMQVHRRTADLGWIIKILQPQGVGDHPVEMGKC